MPRAAREKSETGLYHIMLRGMDHRAIFLDDEDYQRFLETLDKVREVSGFKLFAYCLMGNHVHLLLQEEIEPLETVFKRIGTSLAGLRSDVIRSLLQHWNRVFLFDSYHA